MKQSLSIPFKDRKKQEKKRSTPPNPKKFLKRNQGKWGRISKKMTKSGDRPPKATIKHTKTYVLDKARKVKTRTGDGTSKKNSKLFPRPSARSKFMQEIKSKKRNSKSGEIQVLFKPPPKNLMTKNVVEKKAFSPDNFEGEERNEMERKGMRMEEVRESVDWKKFNDVEIPTGNVFDILVDKDSFSADGRLDEIEEEIVEKEVVEEDEEEDMFKNPFDYDEQIEKFRAEEESENFGMKKEEERKEEEEEEEVVVVVEDEVDSGTDFNFENELKAYEDEEKEIIDEEEEDDDDDSVVELVEEEEEEEEQEPEQEERRPYMDHLVVPGSSRSRVDHSFDSQIYDRDLMDDLSPVSERVFAAPTMKIGGFGGQINQRSMNNRVPAAGVGGVGVKKKKKQIHQKRKTGGGGGRKSDMIGKMFYGKREPGEVKKKRKIEKWKQKVETQRKGEEHERKIKQLESELGRFRSQNEQLVRIRAQLEREKVSMQNSQVQFMKVHGENVEKFKRQREKEMKRLARERRVLQRQGKLASKYQSLKHIELENTELKKTVARMKKMHRQQLSKIKVEMEKFRQRVGSLEQEKFTLQEQVRQKEMTLIDMRFDRKKKLMKEADNIDDHHHLEDENSFSSEQYVAQEVNVEDPSVHPPHSTSRVEDDEGDDEGEDLEDEDMYEGMVVGTSTLEPQVSRLRKIYIEKEQEREPVDRGGKIIKRNEIGNGKIEVCFNTGKREITYPNNTVKKVFPNGYSIVYFNNGDIKKTFPSKKVVYYYATAKTTHISYLSKLEIFHFPNKQIERHYPNGFKEIIFPDGTKKYIHPTNHREEIHFPDGTIQVVPTQ